MKHLSFFLSLLLSVSLAGQINELAEIKSLIKAYQADEDLEALVKAETKIDALFESGKTAENLEALNTKAEIYHLILVNSTPEDPINYAKNLASTYRSALEADQNMSHRSNILRLLYASKNEVITRGNTAYTETDYDTAHAFLEQSMIMNKIERDFPRYMVLDTSILYSKAVFAKMADQNETAISDLEKLVELEYERSDVYDYLVQLYGKEGDDKNVARIQKLKEERFPEN